ncbi:hypothetical protein [Streptomyces sp. WAC04114]|uniref:hypothetical protein n=1 Tax=Streptomyces sp. WAC04114 TaxID=2867961 RepID=UPI001C8B5E43|nr:hypothetical protein [Streptomyces sp. WAC04114]MBX9361065.1 hypothetical protein [Streptomyces sp. WAC04114]
MSSSSQRRHGARRVGACQPGGGDSPGRARHADYALRVDPVSTTTERQDATFRVGY